MPERLNCICIDPSEFSENAFDWYIKNYHRSDDVIGLLHVHQMPQLPSLGLKATTMPVTDDYHTLIKKSVEKSNILIEKFQKKCKSANAKFKLFSVESHHSPGKVICSTAEEHKADLLVLGQRGLSSFSRAILGSTSDYVLHNSEIVVLVIPAGKK